MGKHKGRFIGLWLDEAALRRLDEAAEAAGLSRSELLRELIRAGLSQERGGPRNGRSTAPDRAES